MFQAREPSEGTPSSIAQNLHDLHQLRREEKCFNNYKQTLQSGVQEQKRLPRPARTLGGGGGELYQRNTDGAIPGR